MNAFQTLFSVPKTMVLVLAGPVLSPSDLEGSIWCSLCYETIDSVWAKDRESWDYDTVALEADWFADAECHEKIASIRLQSSYKQGAEFVDGTGNPTFEIDLTRLGFQIAYFDKEDVAAANERAHCGIENWVPGVMLPSDPKRCSNARKTLQVIAFHEDAYYWGEGSATARPGFADITGGFRAGQCAQ